MSVPKVTYLNRKVPVEPFRTYIYHSDGRKRLVNSFEEYRRYMSMDGWFDSKNPSPSNSEELEVQPKAVKKSRKKQEG